MTKRPLLPGETPYQRTYRLQQERKAVREADQKAARHKAIPGGRFRSGPHKDNRAREADRIDDYARDDLGESPD